MRFFALGKSIIGGISVDKMWEKLQMSAKPYNAWVCALSSNKNFFSASDIFTFQFCWDTRSSVGHRAQAQYLGLARNHDD